MRERDCSQAFFAMMHMGRKHNRVQVATHGGKSTKALVFLDCVAKANSNREEARTETARGVSYME